MAEHQEPGSARAGIAAPAGAPEDPGREARAPESRRFRLLREAFLRAARRGSAVERERVEEAFAGQGLSEDDMVQLHDMLESVLGQYVKACRDEFEDIAREYDTASKLADLESLCAERGVLEGIPAEALATAEGPRPAAEAMRARYEAMTREREVLREILQTAKAEQEQAARELEEKRSEAERRVKDLAPAVEGIKGLDEVSQQWAARP